MSVIVSARRVREETTPDRAYRWWYRDPLTKILFKGTFAEIGVGDLSG
ncbi:hypothetical protein ACTD5D_18595 [Nocardia takedensis]|nr:hypothetical protein [Nocardia takedensis]